MSLVSKPLTDAIAPVQAELHTGPDISEDAAATEEADLCVLYKAKCFPPPTSGGSWHLCG